MPDRDQPFPGVARHLRQAAGLVRRFAERLGLLYMVQGDCFVTPLPNGDNPWSSSTGDALEVPRLLWDALVELHRAMRLLGATDEKGASMPDQPVARWCEWRAVRAPARWQPVADEVLIHGRAINDRLARYAPNDADERGIPTKFIPIDARRWAEEMATTLERLACVGDDLTGLKPPSEPDVTNTRRGGAFRAASDNPRTERGAAAAADTAALSAQVAAIAEEIRRLPTHNTSPADRAQLGGRLVAEALNAGVFDSAEHVGWRTAIEQRLDEPRADPWISAWAELAYRVRLARGLPTVPDIQGTFTEDCDLIAEELELLSVGDTGSAASPDSGGGDVEGAVHASPAAPDSGDPHGKMIIDRERFEVRYNGSACRLALGLEFKLLERLNKRPGIYVSIGTLISDVWGANTNVEKVTVQATVSALRKKLRGLPGVEIDGKTNAGHYALFLK